jgi:hypothetical protein
MECDECKGTGRRWRRSGAAAYNELCLKCHGRGEGLCPKWAEASSDAYWVLRKAIKSLISQEAWTFGIRGDIGIRAALDRAHRIAVPPCEKCGGTQKGAKRENSPAGHYVACECVGKPYGTSTPLPSIQSQVATLQMDLRMLYERAADDRRTSDVRDEMINARADRLSEALVKTQAAVDNQETKIRTHIYSKRGARWIMGPAYGEER